MKIFNTIIATVFCLALFACGSDDFEGDYVSKIDGDNPFANMMKQKLSFQPNGKVSVFLGKNKVGVFKYEKNGDEIALLTGDGTEKILTIEDDGSLFGGGAEYIKVSSNAADGDSGDESKAIEEGTADKLSSNIIGKSYVSKPNPAENPEYASTVKLLFGADGQVKISLKHYDTGAFRENEQVFQYEIDDDKITMLIEDGSTQTITIRENGGLLDDGNNEYIIMQ